MGKYKARDAPVPGSSVSGAHHGWWSDQIKHEENIKFNWFKQYGQFYVKELVGLRNDNRPNPIDGHLPPVQPCKYLTNETIPESQPVAYLRACVRQKEIHDAAIDKGGLGVKMNSRDTSGVGSSQKNVGGKVHPAVLCFENYKNANVPMPLVHDFVTTRITGKGTTGFKEGCVSNSRLAQVFDRCVKNHQATSGTVKNTEKSVYNAPSECDCFLLTPEGHPDLDQRALQVGGCSWSEMQHRPRQMFPSEESTHCHHLRRAYSQMPCVEPNVGCAKVLCPHNIYPGSFHDGNVSCKTQQVSSKCQPGAQSYSRLPSRNVPTSSPRDILALRGRARKSSEPKGIPLPFCTPYPFLQETCCRIQNELIKRPN